MEKNSQFKLIFEKLTGDRASYTMENRAFNFVSLVSFLVLFYFLVFDIYIGQIIMCLVLLALIVILSFLYYNSLVKRKYRAGIIVYAVATYGAIITNYYFNQGIDGPTMFLFFLTFHLLVAISPPNLSRVWIILHASIAIFLLFSEYFQPGLVPDVYTSRLSRFMDIGWTYIISIVFVYFITRNLRSYYIEEKKRSDDMVLAVSEQNELILQQNKLLEKSNEEKNKMFSIVSHDLRSPIDSIRGYLEVLSEDIMSADEKRHIESELLNQVKYTSDLLVNLLYWSKTQMKGVSVNLVPIKIKDMVDDARNFKMAGAAKKNIKLTYAIDRELEVIADKDMLRIVLRNLVVNAIKFTKPGGEIVIGVKRKNDKAEISIKDNGIGIPAEKQREIFSLKTNSTYGTNEEKGMGLGLMLCKEFVEYQNGTIWFESEEGKGSTFFISLPLTKA